MSKKLFEKNGVMLGDVKWYRKKTIVPMVQMDEPFICESREGLLEGQAGDFVAEDGHGGFYPISAEFHANNYEEVEDQNAREEVETRIKTYRALLKTSYFLFKSKKIIVLKDDDEAQAAVDIYLAKLEEHGIPESD